MPTMTANGSRAAPDRLLRLPEVRQMVGLSRSSIYALEAAGKFPKRVAVSERAVAWRLSGVQEFIEQRAPKLPPSEKHAAPKSSAVPAK